MLSALARLNSDPESFLDGCDISPGELRKTLLVLQLRGDPELLLLDEPTNHLDVGSIEGLEALLAGFPGAFVVITHDERLERAIGTIEWRITPPIGQVRKLLVRERWPRVLLARPPSPLAGAIWIEGVRQR